MNLNDAEFLFRQLAVELELPENWRFEFDNARRRFGSCNSSKRLITLSRYLTILNTPFQVEQTIRHEIAHAKVGTHHGHNHVWRAMARQCGDDGVRCYSHTEVVTPPAPYQATCKRCGTVVKRHRALPTGRTVSCGRCSRRYDPTNLLEFKRVSYGA